MAKQDQNKELRRVAKSIAALEKEISLGNNVKENQNKIQLYMSRLSLEDMLWVDEYIHNKNLI